MDWPRFRGSELRLQVGSDLLGRLNAGNDVRARLWNRDIVGEPHAVPIKVNLPLADELVIVDPRSPVLEWVLEPPHGLVLGACGGSDLEAYFVLLLDAGGGLARDSAAVITRDLFRRAGRVGYMARERGTDVDVIDDAVLGRCGRAGVEAA